MTDAVNSKKTNSLFGNENKDDINLLPLLLALLKKLWLIALAAVIVGAATFAGTKFLITPTYRASFTAYVNNRSQLNNGNDTLSSSDLTAAQDLVRAYSKVLTSRTILEKSAEAIKLDESYSSLRQKVSTQVENDTGIITVYVIDTSREGAYNLATSIASSSPNLTSNIIEGSSMRIIDMPTLPDNIFKPNYFLNTAIGVLAGALIAVAYVVIRFLLDDKVKNEKELEEHFSLPIVGIIPDMNLASKNSSNYYDYEYAYRYSDIKRSGGSDGKK